MREYILYMYALVVVTCKANKNIRWAGNANMRIVLFLFSFDINY